MKEVQTIAGLAVGILTSQGRTEMDKMMDTTEEGPEYKLLVLPYGQHTNHSAVLVQHPSDSSNESHCEYRCKTLLTLSMLLQEHQVSWCAIIWC
jgi:hypothetical protein